MQSLWFGLRPSQVFFVRCRTCPACAVQPAAESCQLLKYCTKPSCSFSPLCVFKYFKYFKYCTKQSLLQLQTCAQCAAAHVWLFTSVRFSNLSPLCSRQLRTAFKNIALIPPAPPTPQLSFKLPSKLTELIIRMNFPKVHSVLCCVCDNYKSPS